MKAAKNGKSASANKSAKGRIYNYLHQQLSSGAIPAGQVISELQLSRTLGTSRSPIREAIGQLVSEGLLEQAPNRSAMVINLSREDIVDLFEVREALEIYAVRKVAGRGLHPTNHAQLKECLENTQGMISQMKSDGQRAMTDEQMAEFTRIDHRLHALLVISTQNARMQKIVSDTRVLVRIFAMRHHGYDVGVLDKIQRQHVAIVQAVAKGKSEEAARLLSEHIRTSLQERLEEFDLWKRERAVMAHSLEMAELIGQSTHG
jgi:DNA-binding GntR family transcriptional regulator